VDIILKSKDAFGISMKDIEKSLRKSLLPYQGKITKVLLIPPDYTRMHSGGGGITNIYYNALNGS